MSDAHHTMEILWKAFNILLFLGIVYWFGRKPIANAFNTFFQSLTQRLDSTQEELKRARQEYENAKLAYEDAQRRYKEQLDMTEKTARVFKDEEVKKAQEMAQRVQAKAKEVIDVEVRKAKQELYNYALIKAKKLAVQELQRSFQDPEIQRSYIERSIKSLEEKR